MGAGTEPINQAGLGRQFRDQGLAREQVGCLDGKWSRHGDRAGHSRLDCLWDSSGSRHSWAVSEEGWMIAEPL